MHVTATLTHRQQQESDCRPFPPLGITMDVVLRLADPTAEDCGASFSCSIYLADLEDLEQLMQATGSA